MVEQWHGMEVRPAVLADRFCRLGHRFGRQSMTRGLTVEACIARLAAWAWSLVALRPRLTKHVVQHDRSNHG
jgi:hypothetical protein